MNVTRSSPILVIVVVGAIVASVFFARHFRGPSISIPDPDLSSANERVTALVKERREEVVRNSASDVTWGKLGTALMTHQFDLEARACFDEAIRRNAKELRWPYYIGVILDRYDPAEAIPYYQDAVRLDSKYAPLRVRYAHTLVRLGQLDEAENQLKIAQGLAKDQPYPHLGLARVSMERGDWESAQNLLEKAESIAPSNREVRVELARVRFRLGKLKGFSKEDVAALRSSERFQSMPDPILQEIEDEEVAARRAANEADRLSTRGQYEDASKAYQRLIQDRPDLSRPRLNLASLLMSQGDVPKALTVFREIVEKFPDDAMARFALGTALESTGDLNGAVASYQESLKLKPDYAQAHFALGLIADRNGKLPEAISSYRQAVQADSRLAPAQLSLGVALQKSGEIDEAINYIRNAVELVPNDPVPRDFLKKAMEERKAVRKVD